MDLVAKILDRSSSMIVFALDEHYRYLYFNAPHATAMKNIWGVEIAEGDNMLECITDPEARKKAKTDFERAFGGEEFTELKEYGDSDIDRRYYENRYIPLDDPKGVIVYVSEISDRRKKEKEVEDRQAFLNSIIQDAVEGIVVFEKESGKIIISNKAMLSLLGQSGETIEEKYFPDIFSTQEYQQLDSLMKSLTLEQKSPPIETKCLRCDATEIEVQLLLSCLDFDGQKYVVAFIKDMSQLASQKQRIEEFQKLINVSKDMFSISNPQGYFTQVNPRWTEATGYSEEELLSTPFLEFVHPEDKGRTDQEREDLFTVKQNTFRFENRYITKSGNTIWLEWNSTTLNETGRNYSVARDITEFKQREIDQKKITSSLYKLSSQKYSDINDIDSFIFMVLEEVSKTLELDRLSFWRYDEEKTKIVCTHLLEEQNKKSQPNITLTKKKYPVYFEAITTQRSLSADDVHKDERTAEFQQSYFVEYGIKSMLDVQVENRSNQIGILCAEQIRKYEKWSFDQQSYLIAVSEIMASAFDAHDKQSIIQALSESEALFRAFTNTMPAIIYIKDTKGNHLYANNAQLEYLGTTLDDYIGSTAFKYFQDDYAKMISTEDQNCVRNQEIIEKEFPDPKETGKWFFEYKFPIFYDGKVHRIGGIVVDITERKQLEIRQQKINHQLNLAIDTASLGIWEFRETTKELVWNDVMYKVYDLTKEEFNNTVPNWQQYVHPADAERVKSEFERIENEGEIVPFRFKILTPKGNTKHILASGVRVHSASGGMTLIGVNMDITELVSKEQDLQRQKSMQEILTRITTTYINLPIDQQEEAITLSLAEMGEFVEADRSYIFTYDFANHQCSNIYEWTAEGIEPQIDNLQEIDIDFAPQIYKSHMKGRTFVMHDSDTIQDPDFREFMLSQEIKSMVNVPMMFKNECIGFVGFDRVNQRIPFGDEQISLLKVYAELLVNINRRAENQKMLNQSLSKTISQNNRLKDFSFITSHNIRSSVANLLGLTALLEEEPGNAEYIDMLKLTTQGLDQSIRNLSELINIEKDQLTSREINIRNLVEKEVLVHNRMRDGKNIEIIVDVSNEIVIESIPVYWESIIFNLISNAIKHGSDETDKPIEVKASKADGQFVFQVRDYGKGIPKEVQEEELFKLGSRFHGDSKGQGMGLFLVKNHVDMVGGQIELDSEPGKGTKITIYFND